MDYGMDYGWISECLSNLLLVTQLNWCSTESELVLSPWNLLWDLWDLIKAVGQRVEDLCWISPPKSPGLLVKI